MANNLSLLRRSVNGFFKKVKWKLCYLWLLCFFNSVQKRYTLFWQ